MEFETSTLLWIGGMVITYVAGHSLANGKKKTEVLSLSEKLADANAENETLRKQLADANEEIARLRKVTSPTSSKPEMGANETFIKNINRFTTKLNSLLDASYNSNDWTDDIIDLNNEELTGIWKRIHKNVDSILRIFAMWGIKPENCTSFVGIDNYKEMYTTDTGAYIEKGIRYIVKSPCWILTDNATGKKEIILKGVVAHENN